MNRALFDAVQQKLTDQWTTRSTVRNASDHLLTGFLFDDAGHRMVPTHATKAGVRYRYYVSLPHLHGESKTASVGSVSRVPATDIENLIVKSLNEQDKKRNRWVSKDSDQRKQQRPADSNDRPSATRNLSRSACRRPSGIAANLNTRVVHAKAAKVSLDGSCRCVVFAWRSAAPSGART